MTSLDSLAGSAGGGGGGGGGGEGRGGRTNWTPARGIRCTRLDASTTGSLEELAP